MRLNHFPTPLNLPIRQYLVFVLIPPETITIVPYQHICPACTEGLSRRLKIGEIGKTKPTEQGSISDSCGRRIPLPPKTAHTYAELIQMVEC